MTVRALAPDIGMALVGVVLLATGSGAFLVVDWALMTEIIPKAAAGRYMGMSNVATASNGAPAVAIGGTVMDLVGGPALGGNGPRAALILAISFFAVGAILL